MELEHCKLFDGLPSKELKKIASEMSLVTHPAGKHVMEQGRDGVGFMVILEGEAEVQLPGNPKRLKEGEHFGEMALLDNQGRIADVVALTDLKVYALPAWGFETFLESHPKVAYRMLQTFSRRLREAETA